MIRLMLVDDQGKPLTVHDLATAAELCEAADKARAIARECERRIHAMSPHAGKAQGRAPYL